MDIRYDFNFNAISFILGTIAWCLIAIITYRLYKKQADKPTVFKVLISIYAGLFSFSFNWQMDEGTPIKISILPLGVWILYGILKRKKGRWERYRPFLWLGFFSNFIFLAASLITIGTNHFLYPENDLATYISNIETAKIISTHPSGLKRSLDKDSLQNQIHSMKPDINQGIQWNEEETQEGESPQKRNEQFPYQLMGITPKWGSQPAIIYVERDGNGLLVTTAKKQLYFRSQTSFLKGGE
ncbi:hypothetical protein [Neobacillus cucumis]|nr:hypothetical protein [Neobacillus cucumis]